MAASTAAPAASNEIAKRNNNGGNQVVTTPPAGPVAQVIKEAKITNQVLTQIEDLSRNGQLCLPDNYSPANALAAAYLMFQDIQNKEKKLIMHNGQPTGVVTVRSMVNALMHMVSQGMNPSKKQCYFIVYGDQLTYQRSYFGDMALAERAMPGISFSYDTINDGDEIEIESVRNARGLLVTTIVRHKKPFPRSEKVIGAYCGVVDRDGVELGYDVFDMARIQKSWSMSKTAHYDNSTHKTFTGEMAMRTVIRHRCKAIINASGDEMLKKAIDRAESAAIESSVAAEASERANMDIIDVTPPSMIEAPTYQDDDETPAEAAATASTLGQVQAPF
jgi:recombination protein RecT